MGSLMINGAKYAVSTALAVPSAITAISNAAPPIASAAVVPAVGDIMLLSSGWGELDEAPVRAGVVTAGASFELEGYDTTDELRFPAGEGMGAYQLATAFVNLPKIHDIQTSGGEQNYATRQYIDDPTGKQVQAPTFKSARNLTYMLDYDPTKPHFDALVDLDRKRQIVILRETLPNGDVIYYAGRVSFNKEPTRTVNEFMSNQMSFSPTSDSVRYPAV